MLVSSVYKSLHRARLLGCVGGTFGSFCVNNASNGRQVDCHVDWKRSRKTRGECCNFVTKAKNYSTETQTKPSVTLPPLSDFPIALWPKLINTFRNFITINTAIKGRLDPEFKEGEFVSATKHALCVVSGALANENYERLEGLVTTQAIEQLREKISTLSNEQKRCIAVEEDDMYLSFAHAVQVFREGDENRERTFVEILMVHHYMQDFGRMKRAGETIPIDMWGTQADRIFVANYRFVREYTENVDSSWIVNVVNHFSPHLAKQLK